MTLRLRAFHNYIWVAFALLLPAMWVAALRSIPDPIVEMSASALLPQALPLLREQNETANFLINLRTDSTFQQEQLEILLKNPLSTPGLKVYWNGLSVGLLSGTGLYRFAPDSAVRQSTLQLRDEVRQQTILEMQFPTNKN